MEPDAQVRHTYRIINKPLTWLGCDKWFVLSGFMLAATFYGILGALLPGLVLWGIFMVLGRLKADDPVRLSMLLVPKKDRLPRYNPATREPFTILFR